jgi:hypothetical protein
MFPEPRKTLSGSSDFRCSTSAREMRPLVASEWQVGQIRLSAVEGPPPANSSMWWVSVKATPHQAQTKADSAAAARCSLTGMCRDRFPNRFAVLFAPNYRTVPILLGFGPPFARANGFVFHRSRRLDHAKATMLALPTFKSTEIGAVSMPGVSAPDGSDPLQYGLTCLDIVLPLNQTPITPAQAWVVLRLLGYTGSPEDGEAFATTLLNEAFKGKIANRAATAHVYVRISPEPLFSGENSAKRKGSSARSLWERISLTEAAICESCNQTLARGRLVFRVATAAPPIPGDISRFVFCSTEHLALWCGQRARDPGRASDQVVAFRAIEVWTSFHSDRRY